MTTPSSGRVALDAAIAQVIARHGEEAVKRGLERVISDPKWKEPIEKLKRKIDSGEF